MTCCSPHSCPLTGGNFLSFDPAQRRPQQPQLTLLLYPPPSLSSPPQFLSPGYIASHLLPSATRPVLSGPLSVNRPALYRLNRPDRALRDLGRVPAVANKTQTLAKPNPIQSEPIRADSMQSSHTGTAASFDKCSGLAPLLMESLCFIETATKSYLPAGRCYDSLRFLTNSPLITKTLILVSHTL